MASRSLDASVLSVEQEFPTHWTVHGIQHKPEGVSSVLLTSFLMNEETTGRVRVATLLADVYPSIAGPTTWRALRSTSSGPIPPALGRLTALERLDLHRNQLSGECHERGPLAHLR